MKDFLKKVLGKDEKFYELLEASADEAQKSAKSLSKLYAQVGKPDFEQASPSSSSPGVTTNASASPSPRNSASPS